MLQLRLFAGPILASMLTACAVAPPVAAPPGAEPTRDGLPTAGLSGMAQAGPDTYLVVHDTKAHRDGLRLGRVEVHGKGLRYTLVAVADWNDPDGRSSDLESACALPEGSDASDGQSEFLVAESSTWEGKFGRLFHLRLAGTTAEILHVFPLPVDVGSDPDTSGDNYEGLACAAGRNGEILVLLGERGGSETYPDGRLRLGILDLPQETLTWRDDAFPVQAPDAWPPGHAPRAIGALHIDGDGTLWAVATADAGDLGPFRSVVYRLGAVDPQGEHPVRLRRQPQAVWMVDGLKIEALSGPAALVKGSVLSFGTEDEDLGGTWRGLFPSVQE